MQRKILLVEDDRPIREMLRFGLQAEGYEVLEAASASAGRVVLSDYMVDLIVCDWMMPGESGVDFVKKLRKDEVYSQVPVIMLTARVEESDKIRGLDEGADDYLTKPVAMKELFARIRALLRRATPVEDDCINILGINLNMATHQLHVDGKNVAIGQTEFKLLKFFLEKPNRVFSRAQLLDFVWGRSAYLEERTVDVHMLRLRKVLKPSGKDALLTTVRGMGYMLSTQEAPNE